MALCLASGWIGRGCWTPALLYGSIALGLTLLAAFMGVAGVCVLGRNRTIYPEPRPGSQLIRHGIYRHVRHPLYASVMLLAIAWGFWRHSVAALCAATAMTAFLAVKSTNEERRLLRRFPDYDAYRKVTHRFFPKVF
jgi:protein-S-isoprenylcysteine O-methyltransferase Ste14